MRVARYIQTGYLVYGRHDGQTLFAVPFDLESLDVTGDPVPVLEPVTVYDGGATQFAVAQNGTALYVPSTVTGERELVELGTDGSEQVLPIAAGDLVLLIQMQHARINRQNSDRYGDGVAGGGEDADNQSAQERLRRAAEMAGFSEVAFELVG